MDGRNFYFFLPQVGVTLFTLFWLAIVHLLKDLCLETQTNRSLNARAYNLTQEPHLILKKIFCPDIRGELFMPCSDLVISRNLSSVQCGGMSGRP